MTDTETSGQQIDAGVQPTEPEASVSIPTPEVQTPPIAHASLEKMVPQSKVNEIVGAAKRDATEKAYEKAKSELQAPAPIEQPVAETQQPSGAVQPQLTEEQVKNIIDRESTRKTNEALAQNMINEFSQKLEAGKGKHEDFESTVAELNLVDNAYLIPWANATDNPADVLYELGKNPAKFASVLTLARSNPMLAQREFMNLSKSIKDNNAGMQQNVAPAPLGQIEPSNTGTDNGAHTVRDLRKLPNLRG